MSFFFFFFFPLIANEIRGRKHGLRADRGLLCFLFCLQEGRWGGLSRVSGNSFGSSSLCQSKHELKTEVDWGSLHAGASGTEKRLRSQRHMAVLVFNKVLWASEAFATPVAPSVQSYVMGMGISMSNVSLYYYQLFRIRVVFSRHGFYSLLSPFWSMSVFPSTWAKHMNLQKSSTFPEYTP